MNNNKNIIDAILQNTNPNVIGINHYGEHVVRIEHAGMSPCYATLERLSSTELSTLYDRLAA